MSKSTKLQNLESKFGLAENLLDELSNTIEEITSTELACAIIPEGEISILQDESILNMHTLKQDFLLIRNNVIKLINTGQRILDGASVLDISDLKPSQLEALANLQATLGGNMKLMLDIYKDIASIEKSRRVVPTKAETLANNTGTINNTNNQIVFAGDSSELLKLINDATSQPIQIN
jgi:hypothetical protein